MKWFLISIYYILNLHPSLPSPTDSLHSKSLHSLSSSSHPSGAIAKDFRVLVYILLAPPGRPGQFLCRILLISILLSGLLVRYSFRIIKFIYDSIFIGNSFLSYLYLIILKLFPFLIYALCSLAWPSHLFHFLCPCVILGGAWHKGSQRNGPRPKDRQGTHKEAGRRDEGPKGTREAPKGGTRGGYDCNQRISQ